MTKQTKILAAAIFILLIMTIVAAYFAKKSIEGKQKESQFHLSEGTSLLNFNNKTVRLIYVDNSKVLTIYFTDNSVFKVAIGERGLEWIIVENQIIRINKHKNPQQCSENYLTGLQGMYLQPDK